MGNSAAFYLELEDYEQSVSIYNDALEIARINEGLYSESQLRIIDAMIAGNEGLADWEAVDDLHHFRYHMASRLWELTDRRHLAAIGTWGGWEDEGDPRRPARRHAVGACKRRSTTRVRSTGAQ